MLNRLAGVFASFQRHQVKYLIIGGIAVVLYGVPRAAFDLDILIKASYDNVERLLEALVDAGFATASLISPQVLVDNEITIFQDRVRIDVQTRTPGITFGAAWERRNEMEYGGQSSYIVCREDRIL